MGDSAKGTQNVEFHKQRITRTAKLITFDPERRLIALDFCSIYYRMIDSIHFIQLLRSANPSGILFKSSAFSCPRELLGNRAETDTAFLKHRFVDSF
jgi:hypothetical protein